MLIAIIILTIKVIIIHRRHLSPLHATGTIGKRDENEINNHSNANSNDNSNNIYVTRNKRVKEVKGGGRKGFKGIREMGGAPRNPAPRKHSLAWIVKSSGCHCTDAFGGRTCRRVPTPLRSTSPFSDMTRDIAQDNNKP